MESEPAITVKNVAKSFLLPHEKATTIKSLFTNLVRGKKHRTIERQQALKDITFHIKQGEFFGIVGRNGSGKSTLLKILAGIYQPNSGSVQVHGKLVPFIELGVGFNPELTGRENVFLNGALLGFSQNEVEAFYDEVVEFAELERFMDQKLKNYSSGMQVRLAFSMAIRANADILLIDEVLAVGDADFQRKCFEYFKKLKRDNKTVVFITHDMSAIKEYCDRCAVIDGGKAKFIGSPMATAERYLRLFNVDKNASVSAGRVAALDERWGDGCMVYAAKPIVTLSKTYIDITVVAMAKRDFSNPVFGVLVKDQSGKPVFGTNSKINNGLKIALAKGESRTIHWRLPNILSSGSFPVDVAISHDNEISQCDWWNNAVTIKVKKEKTVPYPIMPPIEMYLN